MRSITHTKHNLGLDLKSLKQENSISAKRKKNLYGSAVKMTYE